MSAVLLLREHSRVALLDLLRSPGYVVWTVAFPALFFSLFDLGYARHGAGIAAYATLAFVVWAIAGVCLYQFGVGIAQDRGRPWERYVRTLPVSSGVRFGARIASAMVFALMAAGLVALEARVFTPIALSPAQWLLVLAYGIAGGIPFVLFGIAIGYWSSARAAVPLATAINLLLAYAGGLWMPPSVLPAFVQRISPFLPTRAFADLLWSVVDGSNPARPIFTLAIYTVVLAALAARGYRRDEAKRYA